MLKNVVGAIALTVFVLVGVNVVGDLAFPPQSAPQSVAETAPAPQSETPAEPASEPQETAEVAPEPIAETVTEVAPEAIAETVAEAAPEPVAEAVAVVAGGGDLESGQKIFRRKCMTCHTFEKGGRNLTGPNLWGVVGRDKAKIDGFRYSETLSLMGGSWSEENILAFIASPRTYVTDTKMAFAGLKKEQERLDVLAFLKTLTD